MRRAALGFAGLGLLAGGCASTDVSGSLAGPPPADPGLTSAARPLFDPPDDPPDEGVLPAGAEIPVQLDTSISRRTRPGFVYTLTVAQPGRDASGRIVVPAGSQFIGRVVEVRPGTARHRAAVVLQIDSLRADGVSYPVQASFVQTRVAHPINEGYIGDGAGVGSFFGPIGTAIGAGAGSVVSIGAARRSAVLPEGTRLHVRLAEPLSIRAR